VEKNEVAINIPKEVMLLLCNQERKLLVLLLKRARWGKRRGGSWEERWSLGLREDPLFAHLMCLKVRHSSIEGAYIAV